MPLPTSPNADFPLLAKTFFGLEEVLARELRQLGARKVEALKRAVRFEGDQQLMYKANLHLRTALRILKPIHAFSARDEAALYRGVQQLNWWEYMDLRDTIAIDSVISPPYFRHSKYVALKTKDAIVDQFRKRTGRRPNVDPAHPTLRIHVHIVRDQVSISLDSSGDPLFKRGYRLAQHRAPLNEILAAGMLLLTGWEGEKPLMDPMCGSGTIVIEAAMLALAFPPGLGRKAFGFMNWRDFDRKLWQEITREARAQVRRRPGLQILGADHDPKALVAAEGNLRRTKVGDVVQLRQAPFETLEPLPAPGLLLTNPPYGERIPVEEIGAFYQMIGDRLKQAYAGYEAWILSANGGAMKRIGLRADKKLELYNGPLACRFHHFTLYAGKKQPE